MLRPLGVLLVSTKVSPESLLSPGAIDRVADGRERRHRLVFPGVAEELHLVNQCCRYSAGNNSTYQSKSTVTTHTMSRDADPAGVELRERLKHGLGQFLGDIGVHVVAVVEGGLSSVDVETGAGTKVPRVVFTLNVQTACLQG